MTSSIIRGKYVITRALGRHTAQIIENGAILQRGGRIEEISDFVALAAKYPNLPVIGTGNHVVMPGFVNGHHHVGLTPVQLGSPDMPLELWFATRMVTREVDPYLDTLYSAFEMIASGVTTVQHIHGWVPGDLPKIEHAANEVIRGYEAIGMRVSYCYALRDQNHLVYGPNDAFTASVPDDIKPALQRHFGRFQLGAADLVQLFEQLRKTHHGKSRVRLQLAPANLHWCSDAALELLAETSARHDVPMHMHLLETPYQKEYAKRRGGGTAVDYLAKFGLLNSRLTLGHGVWLSEGDIECLAGNGVHVCHNCSSNFRLRSGIAPLNRLEEKGVNVAIGIDEAGINDDRDMLQEMRMVLRAHRTPGMGDDVPGMGQVLRMATAGGALTTPYGSEIGTLTPGMAADLVMINWSQISFPYLDEETPVLDAVLQRAKTQGVNTVMVEGEILYQDGKFTRIDQSAMLHELAGRLRRPLNAEELERRNLAHLILPHVRAFYKDYFNPADHVPHYRQSSRF
ncbi:amidohydrolase family protein [Acidocella aminolytica]|uniref:Amidohydrolase n=1 Tax=Acidocella aminolytica 101 = DSM 11237 TaxID=1120923 RepID=A0A0D6PF14_9PROT|nr:amidohydrolase family protein [Acidocella aminolytica]GAN80340.1 amidohydrolase [Acidocella aminolytica 101 = DSM 11237]GBQ42969.1 amidohydrolase [Acidocella aminolytica 101 = DSM 11237]SHE29827.1 Cytosine/adenosine deaminase [Acidocella aminolytica 101 = DSM 11237]